jgi:hypothetical protein
MRTEVKPTLGWRLERDRLERRRVRMQFVVRELRRRADERRRREGAVPAALGLALQGFEQELAELSEALERSRVTP